MDSNESAQRERSACVYHEFDPETLRPLNLRTEQRIEDLRVVLSEVKGRTVLDVGAHRGLVSLLVARAGASRVTALEPVADDVARIRVASERSGLPIEARQGSVWDEMESGAEVVLALEVLHWMVHQGASVEAAVERLCALTGRTLFLETPWSTAAPSIASSMNATLVDYDMERVLGALLDRGFEVRVLHFCRYTAPGNRRVMLRADRT